jgi:hypothetical protein
VAVEWEDAFWWAFGIAAGVGGGIVVVYTFWRIHGAWRIYRAGPRPLWATRHRIWREPSAADSSNLRFGPGGEDSVPAPPFTFIEEHFAGSQPCVAVRDARNRLWRVKWGGEAKPEAFAVRFAAALGYFAEVTHYLPKGQIEQLAALSRAKDCVDGSGAFADARFELEDRAVRMLFNEHSWAWNDNPFLGTPQLAGLKLVNMLLSNWDTKDRRDVSRGSNTAIFEHRVSRWGREARYLITDWGGAMGKWGANVVARDRWDVDGFEAQTPHFVTGVRDGYINFGYQGQRTAEIARGITVDDVRWFYGYARRVSEEALREGLLASGADQDEARRFARAIADRIQQLGEAIACPEPGRRAASESPGRTVKAG